MVATEEKPSLDSPGLSLDTTQTPSVSSGEAAEIQPPTSDQLETPLPLEGNAAAPLPVQKQEEDAPPPPPSPEQEEDAPPPPPTAAGFESEEDDDDDIVWGNVGGDELEEKDDEPPAEVPPTVEEKKKFCYMAGEVFAAEVVFLCLSLGLP